MYYRLKSGYVLRGWDGVNGALIHRPENSVKVLKPEEFQALLLCDGTIDSAQEVVTKSLRKVLHKLEKGEIIERYAHKTELEEDQYYQYYRNRYVRSVFWSVTGRCNFRCRHCYMDAPEGRLGELSHEDAIALIDHMAACGVLRVDLTGGEPFVRKDFWQLVDRILSHKMTIGQVYTNGWLLDEHVLEEFERRNLKPEFSVSFDGVGWHDWMRGIKGAENSVVRTLELCQKHGFPVDVEMCIHRGNQNSIPKTVELLARSDVVRLKIGSILQTELWKHNSEGNVLDDRAYVEAMLRYIPEFYRAGMPLDVMLSGVIMLRKHSTGYSVLPMKHGGTEKCKEHHLCGSARYTCYITPEGRLLPCMPMTAFQEQEKFPLVQDIGLQKGLSDSFYMEIVNSRISDLFEKNSKCAACVYRYQCGGGCRAIALQRTGDLMGCDSSQCMLWEERYVDRIKETAEQAIEKYCVDNGSAS